MLLRKCIFLFNNIIDEMYMSISVHMCVCGKTPTFTININYGCGS